MGSNRFTPCLGSYIQEALPGQWFYTWLSIVRSKLLRIVHEWLTTGKFLNNRYLYHQRFWKIFILTFRIFLILRKNVSTLELHGWKDLWNMKRVQRTVIKMIKSLENKGYEERLMELRLFILENRRPRGDLIMVFKCIKSYYTENAHQLVSIFS